MGAYLSEPITDKESADDENDRLRCAASSMQGWRVKQEDAHNVILDYDTNASLFAVYDGHGGAEVAKYCAQKLPQFIKYTDAYKKRDYSTALESAFLDIDETLTHPYVIQQLKALSDEGSEAVTDEASDEEENVHDLYEESKMPLEELIARYRSEVNSIVSHFKKNETAPGKSSSSKPKRSIDEAGSSSSGRRTIEEAMEPEISSTSASDSRGAGSSKSEPEISTTNGDHGPPENSTDDDSENDKSSKLRVVEEKPDSAAERASDEPAVANSENGDESKKSSESKDAESAGGSSGRTERSGPNTRKRSTGFYNNFLGAITADDDDDDSDSNDETFEGKDGGGSSEEENVVNGVSGESSEDEGAEEEDSSEEEDEDDLDFSMGIKNEPGSNSGCTAVVALLNGNKLYVANAGDSRCVVCRNGEAVDMSVDHKPEDDIELDRIIKAGGKVSKDGRVNGGLNLSRAIGDLGYKQNKSLGVKEQMITAFPDVKTLTIDPNTDEFMVLACDGIWNFMSSQNVVNFVSERLAEGKEKLSVICEEMFDHCLAPNTTGDGTGCDNMTAVIVVFKPSLKDFNVSETVSKKRPCDDEDTDTNEDDNQPKRLKTDDSETVSSSV